MSLSDLIAEISELQRELIDSSLGEQTLSEIHPHFRESAANLLHYLILRRRDLRSVQERLSRYGLSSLGRAEPQVAATIQVVLHALHSLANVEGIANVPATNRAVDWNLGPAILKQHTDALLGPPPNRRQTRIMVTMPSEGATNPDLVRALLRSGMDCMRINCAHDNATAWLKMIENLRRAERELGRSCRVSMDLAGPKLRTGPLTPLPGVLKVRPQRDDFGQITKPARVFLTHSLVSPMPPGHDAQVPIAGDALSRLRAGDYLRFCDARGARRSLVVTANCDAGCSAEIFRTCYFVAGIELRGPRRLTHDPRLIVAPLPDREDVIVLRAGDTLLVTANQEPGQAAQRSPEGQIAAPARIGCTLPEVFRHLEPGHRVFFDDGQIGGIVRATTGGVVQVEIIHARSAGSKLRSDKGINLPDTLVEVPALTDKDLADLPIVCEHADIVSLSFANSPSDVRMLIEAIDRIGKGQPAIILKIETPHGFQQLPAMLLEAMHRPACGIMIARGDLAVDCGFERLAELQEEILWICEAAHVPVIWATQVLETLAKEGLPSRAEITDAAMGDRAECVMLNKGPYILRAVQTLDDILQRMHTHQSKKRSLLRGLRLADDFFRNSNHESRTDRG